ncbi:hypothetical protein FRC01_002663, partial [Tulasnella sp. 417]
IDGWEKPNGRGGKAEVARGKLNRSEEEPEPVAVKKLLYSEITYKEKFSKIQDMFEGLKYLHAHKPPVCHGDLKSGSSSTLQAFPLRDSESDSSTVSSSTFSSAPAATQSSPILARLDSYINNEGEQQEDQDNPPHMDPMSIADENSSSSALTITASTNQLTLTGPAWSLRWAAPELVNQEQGPGLASDIWSAGWVCWEMMIYRVPFDDLKRDYAVVLKVIQGAVPSVREEAHLGQIMALCSLMMDCWKFEAKHRPHIEQCWKEVRWMPSASPVRGRPLSAGAKEQSPDILLKTGILHFKESRHENAASMLQQVVASAESTDGQVASALEWLGDIYRIQGNYTKAVETYAQAQDIYSRIGDDRGRASAILSLGQAHYIQYKFADAEAAYAQAQQIFTRINNDLGLANTTRALGEVYRHQSKFAEAEAAYAQAQEVYIRLGNEMGRASTVWGLGESYRNQSKFTEAEAAYMEAQEIYARIGHDQGIMSAIRGLGHVYNGQKKYDEAKKAYLQAREISARTGDVLAEANSLRGLGHIHRKQGLGTEAAQFFAQARDLYAQIGNSRDEEDASYWLAVVADQSEPSNP